MLSKIRTAQEDMGEEFAFEDQVRIFRCNVSSICSCCHPLKDEACLTSDHSCHTAPPDSACLAFGSTRCNWFKSSWKRRLSWKAKMTVKRTKIQIWERTASPIRPRLPTLCKKDQRRWTAHDHVGHMYCINQTAALAASKFSSLSRSGLHVKPEPVIVGCDRALVCLWVGAFVQEPISR